MPDHVTSYISIAEPILFREMIETAGADRTREIEVLEAANFELRNEIIGLKLHNATLRQMLKHGRRQSLNSESPPDE
jgi:hypothetical protein